MAGVKGPADAFPRLHMALETERARRTRPNFLGWPLLNSQLYCDWLASIKGNGIDGLRLRELSEGFDADSLPKTPSDFYQETLDMNDGDLEEAAFSVSSMEGAACTFFLGYADSLKEDPYIKDYNLSPRIAAKARIEEMARRRSLINGRVALGKYRKILASYNEVFKKDLPNVSASAETFIDNLSKCK